MPNRLAAESSPYLRQHADNPVEWWPWGEEAFAEAKRRDVPVFVSIGYAACHWCHVMAHESFEDAATAKLMNEHYVNIKIDREERPDVDAIYMNAIMVQGEGGGWPLSAFCLPDGRPYFLGTYFPKVARFNRPSFKDLLGAMADAFQTRRADAEDNAVQLIDGLQRVDEHYRPKTLGEERDKLTSSLLVMAGRQLAEKCDKERGGLAGAPKFPSSSSHELLARAGRFAFGEPAREMFDAWAWGMSEGGIYDHLGGGFARYSVDAKWLVPHFEKMLYDQAQLLSIYAASAAMAGQFSHRAHEVLRETVGFLERELSDKDGGLWSSLDADSEGEEGKFYVWTPAQLKAALGSVDSVVFAHAYGVTEQGNFEHATSVLSRITERSSPLEEEHLADLRAKLLAERAKRPRPGTDDKVLAGWNGLAISGLVAAWRATLHEPALALARRVAGFLRDRMIDGARIARVFHEGKTKTLDGTLDDYAFVAVAFLELAEATGERAWWDLAVKLVGTIRERFVAERDGVVMFFLAPDDDKLLVHRPESSHDGAIPAGSALAVQALLRIGLIGGDPSALELAEKYLVQRLAGGTAQNAWATSALLAALDFYLKPRIVVVTDGKSRDLLLATARGAYAPTLAIAGPWAAPTFTDGKTAAPDGAARAYVCSATACSPPTSNADQLEQFLD